MDLDEIEKKLQELEKEQTDIWGKLAPINARLHELYKEIQPLKIQRDKLRIASSAPEWPELVKSLPANDGSVEMLHYARSKLDEQFDMHLGGYYPDTVEQNIELKVSKTDKSEERNLAGLKYFASILTPHEDGRIWFGIFEHTLSENGIFKLKTSPDLTSLTLTKQTYGHERDAQTFSTPEEAVKYIRQYHWYGDD